MSQLMEQAIAQARELPEAEQDVIASILMREMQSEKVWDGLLSRPESAELLSRLADEALLEARAGRARKLDVTEL